jgi:xylulose-5-phosphate/fructose-6-phosphate phosphoketolase
MAETISIDDHVSPSGRVMEVLSEHCCEGWLEGYLLTGRHGVWATYEGFAQVVDSMLTQHGKWLEQCEELPWRRPIASLNVFLTSHCWRNDHNGFSHQAPGFVDSALSRRSTIIRVYYPPDANTLLSTFDHCLRTRNYLNLVTCGKQEQLQWLDMEEAIEHCSRGASRWQFASNDRGNNGDADPDVILACVGDVPTLETVAASWLLQKYVPEIKIRLVNVIDLTVLMSPDEHPHGMDALSFEALFTKSAPVVFAYHGYRWAIHSMIHGRPNEARFHVRGFLDRGSTTTPFDMVVRNKISRYHLVLDALKYVPEIRAKHTDMVDLMNMKLFEHHTYIREHFEDMPGVALWRWTSDFSESLEPLPLAKGQPRAALFTDG